MAQITIQPGNTLGGIAQKQGTTISELLRLNPQIKDPNLIFAGAKLTLPTQDLQSIQTQISGIQEEANVISGKVGQLTTTDLAVQPPSDIITPPAQDINGDLDGTIAGAAALSPFQQALLSEFETSRKARETAEAKRETFLEKIKTTKVPTAEELRAEAVQALGLPEGFTAEQFSQLTGIISEVDTLSQQLIQNREQMQLEILREGERAIPQGIIDGLQRNVEKKWNIRNATLAAQITAKTAVAQMLRGNIQLAEDLIDKTVGLMLTQQSQRRVELEFMFDVYSDELKTLSAREQSLMGTMLSLMKEEEDLMREDFEWKVDKYIKAGISPPSADTLSKMDRTEVAQDVVRRAPQAVIPEVPEGPTTFTNTQTNKGAAKANLPIKEFAVLHPDVKNYYLNSTEDEIALIDGFIEDVRTGRVSKEDGLNELEGSNIPPEVKAYFRQLINSIEVGVEGTQSFWNKVVNFFTEPFKRIGGG